MNTEHPREDPATSRPTRAQDAPTTPLPDDLLAEEASTPTAATAPLPDAPTVPLTPPEADAQTTPLPRNSPQAHEAASESQGAPPEPPAPRWTTASGDPAQAPSAGPSEASASGKHGARTGTIVWGALILAFCGFVLQRTVAPGASDPAVWITATVLGLGLLLLGVGAAVAIRSRR